MVQDLNMTGHDYNIALFIFFIPYILFEVPSNIIIKRVAPSTWLSIIMVNICSSPQSLYAEHWTPSDADFYRSYGVSRQLVKAWSTTWGASSRVGSC
jgi:hypothetical protein